MPFSAVSFVKAHRIVLLGPPASGKGTQGRLMMERWGAAVVSVGEVLRAEIAAGTPLGIEAAQYMDHGSLVPDRVALASIESWLDANQAAFVFDGFPRTLGQAEALDAVLARRKVPLTAVLWLELSHEMIGQRVSRRLVCGNCGRSFQLGLHVGSREAACPVCGGKLVCRVDDDPATLARRMEQYREHTEPVAHYYELRGLLRRIEGDGTPDEVFARIEAVTGDPANLEATAR